MKYLTELDVTVTLSKVKKPKFKAHIRLTGILYQGEWRFYITNIFDAALTPDMICQLHALRWQVEIYFNLIKNALNLKNIISRTKNGIMIEIYSALIFHLLTQIIIALAAQKANKSIHEFSFERSYKIVKGVFIANLSLFFKKSLALLDNMFETLINIIEIMGLKQKKTALNTDYFH